MLQLCRNATQRVATLVYSEPAFDVTALSGFNPFLPEFLLTGQRIRIWFTEPRSVQMDAVFFAESQVFPRPENCIRQYAFWVISIGLAVAFSGILQRGALVECIPTDTIT